MTGRPLRVLLVEDSPDDATLLLHELRRGGFAVTSSRADTADATAAALRQADWDLVIADFSMPGFSGVEARARGRPPPPPLPVNLVKGTEGEEGALRAIAAERAEEVQLRGCLDAFGDDRKAKVVRQRDRRSTDRGIAGVSLEGTPGRSIGLSVP